MRVDTAVTILNTQMALPPGWQVTAEDWTHRYEDTVKINVVLYGAKNSDRDQAPSYCQEIKNGGARAAFVFCVGECADIEDLVYQVIGAMLENITHEIREFVRIGPTWWAPFHPHKKDGITAWASRHGSDPHRDYIFGVA